MAKTRGQKGLVERRLEEEHRARTLGGGDTKEKPGGSSQVLDTANQVRDDDGLNRWVAMKAVRRSILKTEMSRLADDGCGWEREEIEAGPSNFGLN